MKIAILTTAAAVVTAFNPSSLSSKRFAVTASLASPRRSDLGGRSQIQEVASPPLLPSGGPESSRLKLVEKQVRSMIEDDNANREGCSVEPERWLIDTNQSYQRIVGEQLLITGLSTALLVTILPPIKQLGLIGTLSWGHDIWKSVKAIGPIVAFTVNAPALLNHVMKSIPALKAIPEDSKIKIALLALAKHGWVWPHERQLNALSSGLKTSATLSIGEIVKRRSAHTLRESVLIMCVGQQSCNGIGDKMMSYTKKAIMQTLFDRTAFPTTINPIFTIASRFLYLMAVKEVIDASSKIVREILKQSTVLDKQKK
ncbi:hypothetical protein DID74_01480 [Candidatus Marinamargulisbacteria bacterium SCGC AG-333-B06]|nr:hypothetical protein DID74_01480 [Candidatus Marinamargulisbacteria bacterium SCGC AG-333-B06]